MAEVVEFPKQVVALPADALRVLTSLGCAIGDILGPHDDATRALAIHALSRTIRRRLESQPPRSA